MIDHDSACNVQTTHTCTCRRGVDPERLRTAIRLLHPDEMTAAAKWALLQLINDGSETK